MSKTLAMANGDWYVNPLGQGELIEGRDKALQDFGMYLMCDKYSSLNTLIGNAQVSKGAVSAAIMTSIQRLQSAQSNDPHCTAAERITATSKLELAIDGRDVYFVVDVTTADKSTITVADGLQYRRPQPGASSGFTKTQLNNVVMKKVI